MTNYYDEWYWVIMDMTDGALSPEKAAMIFEERLSECESHFKKAIPADSPLWGDLASFAGARSYRLRAMGLDPYPQGGDFFEWARSLLQSARERSDDCRKAWPAAAEAVVETLHSFGHAAAESGLCSAAPIRRRKRGEEPKA